MPTKSSFRPEIKWPHANGIGWCSLADRTCTEEGGCKACELPDKVAREKATIVEEDDA